jgi:hypothetical protein
MAKILQRTFSIATCGLELRIRTGQLIMTEALINNHFCIMKNLIKQENTINNKNQFNIFFVEFKPFFNIFFNKNDDASKSKSS